MNVSPGYKLTCSATGIPPIYVTLMMNSTVLVNTTNTASIRVYDGGKYTCVATDKYGTDARDVEVSVLGEFLNDFRRIP